MCYDVRYLTKKLRKYAERFGEDTSEIDDLEKQLGIFVKEKGAVYHTTAFDHWKLPVVTGERPTEFQFHQWGLIPHFVKDLDQYHARYANRYLNSRIETLFEEKLYNAKLDRELDNPFYKSALERRCVVVLDGYYDWHWQGKNSYNFHVTLKTDAPMLVAGIWRKWKSRTENLEIDTVSMVTTDANDLCRKVHNKPKASEGPRQLAILHPEEANEWLNPELTEDQVRKVIKIYPANELQAFPVKKLFEQQGRSRIPLNDPECIEQKHFPELEFDGSDEEKGQGSLF